jgi:hypothetical protein
MLSSMKRGPSRYACLNNATIKGTLIPKKRLKKKNGAKKIKRNTILDSHREAEVSFYGRITSLIGIVVGGFDRDGRDWTVHLCGWDVAKIW